MLLWSELSNYVLQIKLNGVSVMRKFIGLFVKGKQIQHHEEETSLVENSSYSHL